jgi:hypothetical protein
MVEEKNTANVAATLVSCSLERRSITTTTQFKPINVYTLEDPTTSAPKVTPPVSESSSSTLITLDQVKQLWDEWNQKLYERVATMHNYAFATPSCSATMSSAPKTMDLPYGMLMNYPKGQLGPSAGFVGTNALIGSMTTNLVNWQVLRLLLLL